MTFRNPLGMPPRSASLAINNFATQRWSAAGSSAGTLADAVKAFGEAAFALEGGSEGSQLAVEQGKRHRNEYQSGIGGNLRVDGRTGLYGLAGLTGQGGLLVLILVWSSGSSLSMLFCDPFGDAVGRCAAPRNEAFASRISTVP